MTTFLQARLGSDGTWSVRDRAVMSSKAIVPVSPYPINGGTRGWMTLVEESFPGAWQQNVTLRSQSDLLAFPPIYACVTLIAGDIAKLRMRLTALTDDDVWLESAVKPNSPFLIPLRKPNPYQTPYQFWTAWVISRLLYGNAYILKVRDNRGLGEGSGMVRQMHVLDPCLVKPSVYEETGEVFYELRRDHLAGIPQEQIYLPASEIIHDRVTPLWHPLVGVSPLYAAALPGTQGVNIANNSAKFFENMSRPSGMLVAPGAITKEQRADIKAAWEANYSSTNMGKTAVLGDDMKYVPFTMPAEQAQLTEQSEAAARWTAMAFHVPPYKLGLDGGQKFNNMQQQDMDYYKQCLQTHMESIEQSLDAGLELDPKVRSQFDEKMLFRMDPISRADAAQKRTAASITSVNEERHDEDMPPVTGGEKPLSQQQYFPIDTLSKRPPPDSAPKPAAPPAPEEAKDADLFALLCKSANPERYAAPLWETVQ